MLDLPDVPNDGECPTPERSFPCPEVRARRPEQEGENTRYGDDETVQPGSRGIHWVVGDESLKASNA